MKLKGNYDITESGIYIVIFEDEKEWEVEFYIWIDKKYNYEETGKQLTWVDVQAKCLSPGFMIVEEVLMEIDVQEHIYNNFSI